MRNLAVHTRGCLFAWLVMAAFSLGACSSSPTPLSFSQRAKVAAIVGAIVDDNATTRAAATSAPTFEPENARIELQVLAARHANYVQAINGLTAPPPAEETRQTLIDLMVAIRVLADQCTLSVPPDLPGCRDMIVGMLAGEERLGMLLTLRWH